MASTRPTIYLAGPMVFHPDLTIFDVMKSICVRHGLGGFAPMDNQIGLEGIKPGKQTITRIVAADFELMEKMDGAVFCLDPFRQSTEMDPGTAVEIGYMIGAQKKMSGWTSDVRSYPQKVRDFFPNHQLVESDYHSLGGTSGSYRDPHGILVHSDGMVANGMAHGGIELQGGAVYADKNWKIAFEAAVIDLAIQFNLILGNPICDRDVASLRSCAV